MTKKTTMILIAVVLLGALAYAAIRIRQHGFSATEKPSWLETYLARHARKIMTPAGAKNLRNPYPLTAEMFASGRQHFAGHCATCHGFDGRGQTEIGRNMYPPAPDMTDAETQRLTDGELFYIIQNGVRFTGMPAWQTEHTPQQTWELVAFLRHLPKLSPQEIEQMRQASAPKAEEAAGHVHTQAHGPEAKPHAH